MNVEKGSHMKLVALIPPMLLLLQTSAFAYQIQMDDLGMYVYKEGELRKDSHIYTGVYEINESNGTLTTLWTIDRNSGERFEGGGTYSLISSEGSVFHQKTHKYARSETGILFVNSLSEDGTFLYAAIKDDYINISHGTWKKLVT
jgi:hypothetical protein